MADYLKQGVVMQGNVTDIGLAVVDKTKCPIVESFSYTYAKDRDGSGNVYGAKKPAILEFSFRLGNKQHGYDYYEVANLSERSAFSFLFNPKWKGDRLLDYKTGVVVSGYIVHMEEEFYSGKDHEGRERQTMIRVKFLIVEMKHFSGQSCDVSLHTSFVDLASSHSVDNIMTGEDSLTLTIDVNPELKTKIHNKNKLFCTTSVAEQSVCLIYIGGVYYVVYIKSLTFSKSIYQPNEIKVRLSFYNTDNTDREFKARSYFDDMFLNRKANLYGGKNILICKDYIVRDIIPSFEEGNLYVDMMISSPDYMLTQARGCQSFVGMKMSDIIRRHVGLIPTDTRGMRRFVDTAGNCQEHIFPYLVQYNESIYDFLRRTCNRWGELMYYEDGKLTFGYVGNDSEANANLIDCGIPGEELEQREKKCYSISYANPDDRPKGHMPGNISLETAQEFLDNMLKKDDYENPVNEIDAYMNGGRGNDKYALKSLGKALTSGNHIPTWASDTLVEDLVSYGQAKKFTDDLRDQFNKDYFENPKDGISLHYKDEQYYTTNDSSSYNEFTEVNGPTVITNFDLDTYKEVLAYELSSDRNTVWLDFDTHFPNLKLGDGFSIGDPITKYRPRYFVVEVSGSMENSRPRYRVKGIKSMEQKKMKYGDAEFDTLNVYPPYLPSGHVRRAGMQKATVVDADDPLRRNRVRVRFDWQEKESDPTPWLMVAQDGAVLGTGSHIRHYRGEQVLVDFIGGNVERPYVVGSVPTLFPQKERWDSPVDAILCTPFGQSIRMSDGTGGSGLAAFRTAMGPGLAAMDVMSPQFNALSPMDFWGNSNDTRNRHFEGNVEIKDYYNIYNIRCSTNDRQISISSPWGDVDINAFTGINITAPNGDIRIAGRNVTIEAGNNLKLVSGTNIKTFQSNLLPDEGAKAYGDTTAAEAAAKVMYALDQNGPIDLALLRNVRDMFLKPVEGVLEVQSNRFLKLEADGQTTGYPATGYKSMRAADNSSVTEQQWYRMGKAIAQLIESTWAVFEKQYASYCTTFFYAQKVNSELKKAVTDLKLYSEATDDLLNISSTKLCNLYDDLKDKLKSSDTKELKEDDLGFVDDMVGTGDDAKTDQCQKRMPKKTRDYIIAARKEARSRLVTVANNLYNATQDVIGAKFNPDSLSEKENIVGVDSYRFLPENYMDAVKSAFSKDKCESLSTIYKTMTDLSELDLTADTYKNLADATSEDNINELKALKRLMALNLLEGLGFKAQKNGESTDLSKLAESIDDLSDDNWKTTAGYIVYKFDSGDNSVSLRKKKVSEKEVWSNAKSGQILIASDEQPYVLGRDVKPMEHQPEQAKTEELVKTLSDPIKDALGVGAVDQVMGSIVNQIKLVDAEGMYRLNSWPKLEEQFEEIKEEEKQQEEKKEEEKQEEAAQEEKQEEAAQEEEKQEEEKKCYYQYGDVIKADGILYVCVSKHNLNEKARFISLGSRLHFNRAENYGWAGTGNDVVMKESMASAETMFAWIQNVLLYDGMCGHLRKGIELNRYWDDDLRRFCPEDDDLRAEFIENLFSTDHLITDAYKSMDNIFAEEVSEDADFKSMPILGFGFDDRDEKDIKTTDPNYMAPTGFLLVDQLIKDDNDGCWVPYILFVDDDKYNSSVKSYLEGEESQNGNHFQWEELGTLNYNGNLTFNGSDKTIHVLKLAVHWKHEEATDPNNEEKKFKMLLDWTKDWKEHPASEMQQMYCKIENTWISKNMTSMEVVFEDTGEKNEECKDVWIYRNDPYELVADAEEKEVKESKANRIIKDDEIEEEDLEEHEMELPDEIDDDEIVEKTMGDNEDEDDNDEIAHEDDNDPDGWNDEDDTKVVAEEEKERKETDAYYKLGDIVKYQGYYYVCVTEHNKNEKARFVTLNDQSRHSKKDFLFKRLKGKVNPDHDTVYSDDMASAETLANWVSNVLFDNDMCKTLRNRMELAGKGSLKQVVPEDDDCRDSLILEMSHEDRFVHECAELDNKDIGAKTFHIMTEQWKTLRELDKNDPKNFNEDGVLEITDDNMDVEYVAPCGYLLADKMRYSTSFSGTTHHWVPYIFLAKESKWGSYQSLFDDETYMQQTSHFTYKSFGTVTYKGKTYRIIKAAIFWAHVVLHDPNLENIDYIILNFTENLVNCPRVHKGAVAREHPDRWENRNITSKELVFTDNGKPYSKVTHFWVNAEQGGNDLQNDEIVSMDNGNAGTGNSQDDDEDIMDMVLV